jgi:septum site-determining protein MinC
LWITLDISRPQELLIAEIDKLFEKLKHLAVNASVVIDMGDVRGHEDFFSLIRSRLIEKFNVGRVTISPQKPSAPTRRIRQRDLSKGWNQYHSNALILKGRVRSGQKIETTRHVMIFGDVNPGAEIIAGGDIIVLGKLGGKVHAGNPENGTAIVFALDFDPTLVKIAAITATGSEKTGLAVPVYASIMDGAILVQDYMKTNPFRKMPWPEVV